MWFAVEGCEGCFRCGGDEREEEAVGPGWAAGLWCFWLLWMRVGQAVSGGGLSWFRFLGLLACVWPAAEDTKAGSLCSLPAPAVLHVVRT